MYSCFQGNISDVSHAFPFDLPTQSGISITYNNMYLYTFARASCITRTESATLINSHEGNQKYQLWTINKNLDGYYIHYANVYGSMRPATAKKLLAM